MNPRLAAIVAGSVVALILVLGYVLAFEIMDPIPVVVEDGYLQADPSYVPH